MWWLPLEVWKTKTTLSYDLKPLSIFDDGQTLVLVTKWYRMNITDIGWFCFKDSLTLWSDRSNCYQSCVLFKLQKLGWQNCWLNFVRDDLTFSVSCDTLVILVVQASCNSVPSCLDCVRRNAWIWFHTQCDTCGKLQTSVSSFMYGPVEKTHGFVFWSCKLNSVLQKFHARAKSLLIDSMRLYDTSVLKMNALNSALRFSALCCQRMIFKTFFFFTTAH